MKFGMCVDRAKEISVNAMGAAIPLALSIALAIRDAVPGGVDAFHMDVRTGTSTVRDEITPEDEVGRSLHFSRVHVDVYGTYVDENGSLIR